MITTFFFDDGKRTGLWKALFNTHHLSPDKKSPLKGGQGLHSKAETLIDQGG